MASTKVLEMQRTYLLQLADKLEKLEGILSRADTGEIYITVKDQTGTILWTGKLSDLEQFGGCGPKTTQ